MSALQCPYFLNTLCTFWPNPILFQGLEKRFHNSIPRGNPDFIASIVTVKYFSHLFACLFKWHWLQNHAQIFKFETLFDHFL